MSASLTFKSVLSSAFGLAMFASAAHAGNISAGSNTNTLGGGGLVTTKPTTISQPALGTNSVTYMPDRTGPGNSSTMTDCKGSVTNDHGGIKPATTWTYNLGKMTTADCNAAVQKNLAKISRTQTGTADHTGIGW